jgi:hypothetical protein
MFDLTDEQYMAVAMALIPTVDRLYMLEKWENSPGAVAEHAYAKSLKKTIVYE